MEGEKGENGPNLSRLRPNRWQGARGPGRGFRIFAEIWLWRCTSE